MAPSKLTVLIPLTLIMLGGASAAPVASPANVPGGAVPGGAMPGPTPQRRGYDGDWLYSRESGLEKALKPTYNVAEKEVSVVNGEVQVAEKRGYDGDWLYSRRSAEPKESGVDAEK